MKREERAARERAEREAIRKKEEKEGRTEGGGKSRNVEPQKCGEGGAGRAGLGGKVAVLREAKELLLAHGIANEDIRTIKSAIIINDGSDWKSKGWRIARSRSSPCNTIQRPHRGHTTPPTSLAVSGRWWPGTKPESP